MSVSKKIILSERRNVDYTANAKVNSDIISILSQQGFASICLRRFFLPIRGTQRLLSFCWWIYSKFILARIPKGSTVVVQYPSACIVFERFAHSFLQHIAAKAKLILLVQDIDVPRFTGDVAGEKGQEHVVKIAQLAYKVIVHNSLMRKWFWERGIDDGKLIELETFDYLATPPLALAHFSRLVTIAGNLAPRKAAYVSHLRDIKDVQWRLFTSFFDASTMVGENIVYAGVCKAEDFPKELNEGFGLVWDGDSVDSCTGNAGKYTLMVSPHKFALYLASGLPVIVSEKAAIANFVREKQVGLVISSLRELPVRLSKITEKEYEVFAKNALNLAHELRDGHFTKKAIELACQ